MLPKQLDEHVARLHLEKIGAELTTLTPEQAAYIGVPVDGPVQGRTTTATEHRSATSGAGRQRLACALRGNRGGPPSNLIVRASSGRPARRGSPLAGRPCRRRRALSAHRTYVTEPL